MPLLINTGAVHNFHKIITIGRICFLICGVLASNGKIMYQNSLVQSKYKIKTNKQKKMILEELKTLTLPNNPRLALY